MQHVPPPLLPPPTSNSFFILLNTRTPYSFSPSLSLSLKYRSSTRQRINPMKHKFHSLSLLLFLLYLIAFSRTSSARSLTTKQGTNEQHNQVLKGVSLSKSEENEDTDQLMGLEICDNGDEECLKRRLLSEAHLDYIYTQHQNP